MLMKVEKAVLSGVHEVTFGQLVLAFTDLFDYRWDDRGSGGNRDVTFYHPRAPEGLRAVGGLAVPNYDNPDRRNWAICIKAADGFPGAVAAPVDFACIWDDGGSGADRDGSCWRPIPPEGYVALGDVFQSGYDKPSGDIIWCVHKDLVADGVIGASIYDDGGTGARRDFSAWEINTMAGFVNEKRVQIDANTYRGHDTHDRPNVTPKVLCLPFPAYTGPLPVLPELTDFKQPAAETEAACDHHVIVPFTAVEDKDYDVAWKVANSPFYTIERWTNFQLELYDNNQQQAPHTVETEITVGVSKSSSETFEHTTGISITFEAGISFIKEAKISGTISYSFGYSSSTSVEAFREKTVKLNLTAPGKHAAALWAPRTAFQLVRGDDSNVGPPLRMEEGATACYVAEYPSERRSKLQRVYIH